MERMKIIPYNAISSIVPMITAVVAKIILLRSACGTLARTANVAGNGLSERVGTVLAVASERAADDMYSHE